MSNLSVTEVTLEKYPKMVTSYFLKDEKTGNDMQVFKLNNATTAKEGATVYSVVTSTGNVHKFAVEVNQIDREAQRQKQAQERELFNLLRKREIGLDAFNEAMKQLGL